ncbi:MAG: glycosyltransferase family 2 protein [Bacteroidota bacterium]
MMKVTGENPKVSVCVVTYNQEKFIRECLQSIVDQETNFDFEVIVGDDCSTDETQNIIREFEERYQGIIRPVFRDVNIGPTANYFSVHNQARGQYVAHIDGDDLMRPGKLQKQASFLDEHPDFSMATHNMVYLENTKVVPPVSGSVDKYPEFGDVRDLFRFGCYFCHSSKMYRRSAVITNQTPSLVVDYFLHIEHALKGNIYFSREALGVYRIHEQGITKKSEYGRLLEKAYEQAFDRGLELGVEESIVERGKIRYRQAIALTALKNGEPRLFKKYAIIDFEAIKYASFSQMVLNILSVCPSVAMGVLKIRSHLNKVIKVRVTNWKRGR